MRTPTKIIIGLVLAVAGSAALVWPASATDSPEPSTITHEDVSYSVEPTAVIYDEDSSSVIFTGRTNCLNGITANVPPRIIIFSGDLIVGNTAFDCPTDRFSISVPVIDINTPDLNICVNTGPLCINHVLDAGEIEVLRISDAISDMEVIDRESVDEIVEELIEESAPAPAAHEPSIQVEATLTPEAEEFIAELEIEVPEIIESDDVAPAIVEARARLRRPKSERTEPYGRVYVESEIACTNNLRVNLEVIPLTGGAEAGYAHANLQCVEGVATVDVDIPGIDLRFLESGFDNYAPHRYQVELTATDKTTGLSTRSQSGYFVRMNRSAYHPQDSKGWVEFGGQI